MWWRGLSRNLLQKLELSIYLDQKPELLYSKLLLFVQVEIYQIILNFRCLPLAFALYKAFLKSEKRS